MREEEKAIFDYGIVDEEVYIVTDFGCKYIDTDYDKYLELEKALDPLVDYYVSDVAEEE